jgi:hypothetical protein
MREEQLRYRVDLGPEGVGLSNNSRNAEERCFGCWGVSSGPGS